jgi:hypothetical protein
VIRSGTETARATTGLDRQSGDKRREIVNKHADSIKVDVFI